MQKRWFETLMGALVLGVAVFFVVWAFSVTSSSVVAEELIIEASFPSASGLRRGSEVHIGGVKIGTVTNLSIDPSSFQAVTYLSLRGDLRLPVDSELRVVSDGFLGGSILRLTPGRSDQIVASGGRLSNIAETLSLEDMLGRAIFIVTDRAKQTGQ